MRRESTCPPWKPIAARLAVMCVQISGFDELGQHSAARGGVEEGDARAADADPRRLVDQPHAALAQQGERRVDLGHLVRDVVEPRAALGEEPADRRVVRERAQQLDVVLADVEQHRLDALLGHGLAVDDRHAVRPLVQRERGVEVRDGDADVVDPLNNGRR